MASVQLTISDEDRDRFMRQARSEGLTLSAWLTAVALDRLEARHRAEPVRHDERFESLEDLKRFFEECDARRGSNPEPDWEEHKRAIAESRIRGLPNV